MSKRVNMRAIVPRERFALLIVEGDIERRRELETAAELADRFWSIEAMADGRFALEHLWTCLEHAAMETPDILIANTTLPGIDGIGLTRALRRYEPLRPMFVALLSGTGAPQEQDAAETAGCDFYLRRPRERAELVRELHAIANRCGIKALATERL